LYIQCNKYFVVLWLPIIYIVSSLCAPNGIVSENCFDLSCTFQARFTSLKPNIIQICCSFILAITKLQTALIKHNNKQMLQSNAEGYSCKTYLPDSEDRNIMALWAERCTTCHSLSSWWAWKILDTHSYINWTEHKYARYVCRSKSVWHSYFNFIRYRFAHTLSWSLRLKRLFLKAQWINHTTDKFKDIHPIMNQNEDQISLLFSTMFQIQNL